MERRSMPRFKKRIPVHYTTEEGMQHSGLSMDVSPAGLFIIARDKREPDEVLCLEADLGTKLGFVEMTVRVARKREAPRAVGAVHQSGFAVMVLNAPEEWYQFLKGLVEGAG